MNIQKEKNHTYKIDPIKMANDAIIKKVVEPLPNNYGFFLMIVGKPNSGKSTLWINLINKKSKFTYYMMSLAKFQKQKTKHYLF